MPTRTEYHQIGIDPLGHGIDRTQHRTLLDVDGERPPGWARKLGRESFDRRALGGQHALDRGRIVAQKTTEVGERPLRHHVHQVQGGTERLGQGSGTLGGMARGTGLVHCDQHGPYADHGVMLRGFAPSTARRCRAAWSAASWKGFNTSCTPAASRARPCAGSRTAAITRPR